MNNNSKDLIVVGGGAVQKEVLSSLLSSDRDVIGVDKGCDSLLEMKIIPKAILGDMDSIDQDTLKILKGEKLTYLQFPDMKDETDLELAIQYGINEEYKKLYLVGCTGTRLDHTLGNIILLSKYHRIDIEIIDGNNRIYLKNNDFFIEKKLQYGNRISFFAFPKNVLNLTLKGFKYPLNNFLLKVENQLCISNEIIDDIGYVSFNGQLIVMETKD